MLKVAKSIKALFAMALAAVVLIGTAGTSITPAEAAKSYGNVGYHLNDTSTNGTGMLVMGDSRICQMFAGGGYGLKGAAVSTWGGHYGYGAKNGLQINTDTYMAQAKKTVVAELQKTGKCKVIIEATVNDYDGGSSYTSPVSNQIKTAKTAYSWTAKYKGKTVHPTVYCTSLVASKSGSASKYNSYLKKQLENNKTISYLSIAPKTDDTKSAYYLKKASWYQKDGVHYTKSMVNVIWKKMNAAKF